jgi:SAM-dependent methyltransferase
MASMARIQVANVEAARAWDGQDGAFWAEHQELFDAAVAPHHARLIEAAGISPTDRVLDIGCGNGQTACDAARRARAGHVVGVDLSSPMLAVAERRAREQRLTNVTFIHGDAQVHAFTPGGFDIAISRTGTMFFRDPVAAFANIGQALRPGGRLVQLTWQSPLDNEWIATFQQVLAAGRQLPQPPADTPGPFSLADRDRARRLLADAGFVTVEFEDVREPMYFGRDVDEALGFVSRLLAWLLIDLDEHTRRRALAQLRENIAAHHEGPGVHYRSAAWLIVAAAPPAAA